MKSGNIQRLNWQNLDVKREREKEKSKIALGSLTLMTVRIPGLFTGVEGTK